MSEKIVQAIQQLAGTHLKDEVYLIPCTVDSVNVAARTCDCTTVGGTAATDMPNVELMADVDDGFLLVPAVGSTVIVCYSKRTHAYVSMFSGIDNVYISAGKAIQFNDGSFDGLVKVKDLVTKLNNLENDLNTIKQVFTTWTPVSEDGGAALKAAATSWAGQQLTQTQQPDLENTTVKHGK